MCVSMHLFTELTALSIQVNNGTLIGWVNIPLFDPNGKMRQESVIAGLWPPVSGILPEHRSTFSESNRDPNAVLIEASLLRFKAH